MKGLGLGNLGLDSLGVPAADPIPQGVATLSSSRAIDADGRYVMTANGDFVGMPDIKQRVVLAVSFGAGPSPATTDQRSRIQVERNVRAALADLAGGREPLIAIVAVNVTRSGPGHLTREVIFRELTNDITHTVTT